ncbi:hypothetical protein [Serratia fonticola]|uniref:hypothetical protein n=1 Tax=Serratia fonticola TaxID=47917 RepID=UPI0027EF3E13|nr:hypothetical protein [Serratia fonticola]MDQ7208428.1 hypothetical protein [Serratia fonticola]HBE9078660.1 hypothetical protein [Serratia fonticola]HBE9089149.1 hypothetical protein [Serratia fonticola]HBE9151751.1 hypothetical protein [Serratia fonticola]
MFDSKVTLPQRRKIGNWQSLNVEKAAKAAFESFKLLQKNAVRIPVVFQVAALLPALAHPSH